MPVLFKGGYELPSVGRPELIPRLSPNNIHPRPSQALKLPVESATLLLLDVILI